MMSLLIKNEAVQALRMERRLEMAHEGIRFFEFGALGCRG